jgi:hypothetical protein
MRVIVFAAVLAASGCVFEDAGDHESTATSDIDNGTPWNPWSANNPEPWTQNVVQIHIGGLFCTGTLLDYEWVMTAGHCFSETNPPPSGITVTHVLADGSTESSVAVEQLYDPNGSNGVDVAMVRLATPLHPGQATLPLYSGTTASLVGQSVFCAGYGAIAVGASCGSGLPSCPSGQFCQYGSCLTPDDNTLRTATFSIIADPVDPNTWYQFAVPNAQGQLELPGDSGSTCWNGSALTGVDKAGNTSNYNRQTAIPAARAWIESLVAPTLVGTVNRPGARCRPATGAAPAYSSDGGVYGGAYGAVMNCPIDRPIAPTVSTFVSAPNVWVVDQNPTSDVCCHLLSKNPSGVEVVGNDVCSSGASSSVQTLTLPSVLDETTYSHFDLVCTVPAANANGGLSGIDGYRVSLFSR